MILNFNVFKLYPFSKIIPLLEISHFLKKSFESTIVKSLYSLKFKKTDSQIQSKGLKDFLFITCLLFLTFNS